jgi:type II secretory pathway pseudopilin PulG
MRLPRDNQAGWTLIELLIGSTIMLIVLGASLTTFETFLRTNNRNAAQNDAQDSARTTQVALSRQLRNLAGPAENQPQAFERVTAYDLIFKTVNPLGPASLENPTNVERVRYCLDSANPAKLWMQFQTWTTATPPAMPAGTACPDGGWPTANKRLVAKYVVNRRNGMDRPVFAFNFTDPAAVTEVRSDLYVDVDPNRSPSETHLQSGVFLRNQNRVPSASLQVTQGNSGHLILNASSSSDPEGQLLFYSWEDGGTKLTSTSAVWDYQTALGAHTITLTVCDPAGLTATSTWQGVVK